MNHQTMYYFVGLLLSVCLVSVVWIFKPSTVFARSETIVTRPTPALATWEHSGQSMLAQQPARPTFVTGVEQLPASLQGTEVNGELAVDTWGNLIVSHAVRQLFDYFLSADGEEDQAMLVQRIRAYIRHQLKAPAQAQAEALLDQYLAYLQALKTIPAVVGDPMKELAQVRQQKQQVADLRAQHFDPLTSEAFFGAEDAYDQYTLARLDVLNDPQLSPTEKAKRIGAIMATLAPQMQDDLKAINQYQDLTALTSEWKAQSGSAQALRQLRESVVGVAATDRLETLDQEVAAWDQRVNAYLAQRDALHKQTSLAPTDQQHAIEQLKQRLFSAQEQVRIDALERIHDQGLQVNMQG
jgi:lipase chaperone LimK